MTNQRFYAPTSSEMVSIFPMAIITSLSAFLYRLSSIWIEEEFSMLEAPRGVDEGRVRLLWDRNVEGSGGGFEAPGRFFCWIWELWVDSGCTAGEGSLKGMKERSLEDGVRLTGGGIMALCT